MSSARCPCCEYRTLEAGAEYEICPVCFWEDDGQGAEHAQEVWGGPNGSLSLSQAQENFRSFGACDHQFVANVRPPRGDER